MQVQKPKMLEAGEYVAQIIEATETQSKAGNDMLVVKLMLDGPEERTYTLTDYILADNAKLPALLKAVGLESDEGARFDAAALSDKVVKIKTFIKPARGEYGPKSAVKAYMPAGGPTPAAPAPAASGEAKADDNLPF